MQVTQDTRVQPLGWEDALETGKVTHSSILSWRIPVDRGAWRATVHGVTKSRTRPSKRALFLGTWRIQMKLKTWCLQIKSRFQLTQCILGPPPAVSRNYHRCFCNARIRLQRGRPGFDPRVGKIPWRRERLPAPVFWPGEVHCLCSWWGRNQLDTTQWLSLTSLIPVDVDLNSTEVVSGQGVFGFFYTMKFLFPPLFPYYPLEKKVTM